MVIIILLSPSFTTSTCMQIDVLVNNAGQSQRAEATQTDLEVDRAVLELNTIGTISLTKSVLPHMIEQRSGTIVIISSVAGKMGKLFHLFPLINLTNFSH